MAQCFECWAGLELECTIYAYKEAEECLYVEQSRELRSKTRDRGGASNACFHS